MNVMISGSRGLPPLPGQRKRRPLPESVRPFVREVIQNLAPGSTVTHGDAEGFDKMAEEEAVACGLQTFKFPPEYDKHPPKVAPLIRNEQMAEGPVEVLFAFAVEESRGTMHAVKCMMKRGKGVILHHFDAEGNFLGFSTPYDLA